MIGQDRIVNWVEKNIDNFPHFIVLVGSEGSGKRTVAKFIASKLSLVYSECEIRTEAVREVIDVAYKSTTNVLYCFANADVMKVQAKNAMLKITEEPPKNAYFCLTVCDDSSLLDTIKSRAQVFNLEPYTTNQIEKYALEKYGSNNLELIRNICNTPGEVDMLKNYNIDEFCDYVKLVFENIAEVEPANAFKSSSKLQLKGEEGYDLKMFWKVFIYFCSKNWFDLRYAECVLTTTKCLNKLEKIGVNKQQLYDLWVLEIRSNLLL